jgi:hypothetical protein
MAAIGVGMDHPTITRIWPVFLEDGEMVGIEAPSLRNHLRVSSAYDLLQEQLVLLEVDPISLDAIQESDEGIFFDQLQPWYDLLLKAIGCKFQAAEMDWRSRYAFFLAGPRVKWREYELPDLAGISKLLGYARTETDKEIVPPKHTTGTPALDALVSVALCFKKQYKMFLDLPLADAIAATAMAGGIYAEQQAELDKKYNTDKKDGFKPQLRQPSQSKEEPAATSEDIQKVAAGLKSAGFAIPDGI